jgi:hypothetical protein
VEVWWWEWMWVERWRLLRGRSRVGTLPHALPVAEAGSQGSCVVVHPGILNATEEETAVLRRLREDGAAVEMEEKGSRLVESNGACVELGTNPAVNVVHGAVDITGAAREPTGSPRPIRSIWTPRGRERRNNASSGREERRTAAGLQSTWNSGDLPEMRAS